MHKCKHKYHTSSLCQAACSCESSYLYQVCTSTIEQHTVSPCNCKFSLHMDIYCLCLPVCNFIQNHAVSYQAVGLFFKPSAWTEVQATVLMMSATVQPRLRSLTGFVSPCMTGPMAIAPVDCCTACRCKQRADSIRQLKSESLLGSGDSHTVRICLSRGFCICNKHSLHYNVLCDVADSNVISSIHRNLQCMTAKVQKNPLRANSSPCMCCCQC